MSIDMKHNNGTVGMAACHSGARAQAMGVGRVRSDMTGCERDVACAAIDDAMQSVSHVLEVAIQAMGTLRVAQAALVLYDDGPPPPSELGEPRKTR